MEKMAEKERRIHVPILSTLALANGDIMHNLGRLYCWIVNLTTMFTVRCAYESLRYGQSSQSRQYGINDSSMVHT
jgi:DICT domain-containing protein